MTEKHLEDTIPPDMEVHPYLETSLWTLQSLTAEDRRQFIYVCGRLFDLQTGEQRTTK